MAVEDMMAMGIAWQADKMKAYQGRVVTYRGIRAGNMLSADITASVGGQQGPSINSMGMEPSAWDYTLANPVETNRDYDVWIADLAVVGLWPAESGDLVDDANDEVGVVNRYEVKSVPGQAAWRPFRGGYTNRASIHAKFFQVVTSYWRDTFTGTDGANLTGHIPEVGSGGYGGGIGTIEIQTNKIVATTASAWRFFDPGHTETEAFVSFAIDVSPAELNHKFAELGIGARCEDSGPGQRDGFYCTVKVGYFGTKQKTKRLKIQRMIGGLSSQVALLDLKEDLDLSAIYQLKVTNKREVVILTLSDATGEVALGSVDVETSQLADNTAMAVYFAHTLADPSLPWLNDLSVEGA